MENLGRLLLRGWRVIVLYPLSALHALCLVLHQAWLRRQSTRARQTPEGHPRPPLLVVGGLKLRGSGKTSVTAALAEMALARNRSTAVLLYDSPEQVLPRLAMKSLPLLREVSLQSHWPDFSDEALLMKHMNPGARVFVTRHRLRAWQELARTLPDLQFLLSDDGLFDPRLVDTPSGKVKRLALLETGENPGWRDLFPSGDYRGTMALLRPGDLILHSAQAGDPGRQTFQEGKAWRRELHLPLTGWDKKRPTVALCGHGQAEAFFDFLEKQNVKVVAHWQVANHRGFPARQRLGWESRLGKDLQWICSPRDAMKLLSPAEVGDGAKGWVGTWQGPDLAPAPLIVCGHRATLPPCAREWAGPWLENP